MAVDVYRPHDNLLFLGYDIRDIADDANVIITDDTERDGILALALSAPPGLHYAVSVALSQLRGVRAVGPVYLYSTVDGDEAEDRVAVDRMAAVGK